MEVKPFKAFRFDPDVVGNAGDCIAPPYDVISPAQQELLYQKNRYNIVRIIRGKTEPSDNDGSNQYTRATDYLSTWIKDGVLKQDSIEAIYPYIQDFESAGSKYRRFSFIALAKLEEFGKTVRPHEQVLDKPITDRLNLTRATGSKFGLPFMLYEDKQAVADGIIESNFAPTQAEAGQKPLIDFIDEHNVRHRLFAIAAKDQVEAIVKMMHDKSCIIADGHHRYVTALTYYKENKSPAAAYQMFAFANTCNEGLIVLATHRLVGNLQDFSFEKLLVGLRSNFQITEYRFDSPTTMIDTRQRMLAQMKAEYDRDKNAFGIYGGNNAFYVAVLKNEQAMNSMAPNMSRAWKSLDVSVLHKLILEKLLGIGEKQLAGGGNIEYVKDTDNAVDESIAAIDTGKNQVAFFMNPVKMRQLMAVTDTGEKMPQKSTYFYPKIYTGLTISK